MKKVQNYIQSPLLVLALSLLLHSEAFPGDNSSELYIALDASKTKFDSQLGFDSPVGYGGQISYSLLERLGVGLSFSTATTKKTYEVIEDLEDLNIATRLYQIQLRYLLFRATPSLHLHVNGGFGFINFKTPQRKINLGALGQMTIPEETDSSELFSGGITVTKQLNTRISAQLSPELFMFKNKGVVRSNFSIAGGFSVGVL